VIKLLLLPGSFYLREGFEMKFVTDIYLRLVSGGPEF
jgi:hypothetical protein